MEQEQYKDKVIALEERRTARAASSERPKHWRDGSRRRNIGIQNGAVEIEKRNEEEKPTRPPTRHTSPAARGRGEKVKSAASRMRVIAITSGKGGVGKTNIVANLGYVLSRTGARVLILDADLGLGNLDILLGITPKYNLSHVIMGERTIPEIAVEGPGAMLILPAASGIQEITHLTGNQRGRLLEELKQYTRGIDVLLIDTAAGISSNVMCFNAAAQEVLVVVSPEPTSITDAYALMKVLSLQYRTRQFRVLVNLAADTDEAYEVYRQLRLVADRFLDVDIEYLGYVLFDKNVSRCVRRQKVVSEILPSTPASQCFYALGRKIGGSPSPHRSDPGADRFWNNLFDNDNDEGA